MIFPAHGSVQKKILFSFSLVYGETFKEREARTVSMMVMMPKQQRTYSILFFKQGESVLAPSSQSLMFLVIIQQL